jgi:hypothetical protein
VQAARDKRKEKEVSLDALKQVEMECCFFTSPELCVIYEFDRENERGPNVYLPPPRWQVANLSFILSLLLK